MSVYLIVLFTLSSSFINCSDQSQPDFFDHDLKTAAKEAEIIDWALLYAVKKESINTIAESIEKERYYYYQEDDRDLDLCCGAVERVECPLHIKARLTTRDYGSDYAILQK